jgi:hypothetical protein
MKNFLLPKALKIGQSHTYSVGLLGSDCREFYLKEEHQS